MAEQAGKVGAIYAMTGSKTTIADKPIGTGNASDTVFYLVETLDFCEDHSDTEWSTVEGTLSTESGAGDFKEGTNAVRDTGGGTELTEYKTLYTHATSVWDWHDRTRISFWFYSDKASTVFEHNRFYVEDTDGNRSYWTLTFSAATWTRFDLLLGTPTGNDNGAADLTKIELIEWNIKTKSGYTDAFYKAIDWIGITPQAVDKDITVKVAGTALVKGTYLHTVSGKVTLSAAPASAAAILATYDEYAIAQVGGFFNWSIAQSVTTLDKTDFQSAGWKEFLGGLKEWSASAERHWMSDESLVAWLGVTKIIKFFMDESSDPQLRYEGWAIINGLNPGTAIDTIINESLDFQGTGNLSYESI